MKLITLDWETFYSQEYTLSSLTTEEYINSPEFEVIGVGIKEDDGETVWISGPPETIFAKLKSYDWENSILLCHNTAFDGAILAWRFGIKPAIYMDTLCMARALHGVDVSGSLAALAERYQLGIKGTEVINAKGKRRADFSPEELERYGDYCMNDVFLTWLLFKKLVNNFPYDELRLIDMTLRMFIEPVLEVNDSLLVDRLEQIRAEKKELLGALMNRLECEDEEAVRKKLSSNKQFAELLIELGIDPPTKISPTTGKETYALAKNDIGFIELSEHEDEFIQQLCAVRLGTKSTIEESRIERFIDTGARNKGKMPVYLKYYGAHTGRWSGGDGVNWQNLPSRDKKKKALKNSIVAPEGHVIINSDSSQIEARVLAWLAGQDDVVQAFAEKRDIYCEDASKAFGRVITKADTQERFFGKTMRLGLGFGTGSAKLKHTLTLGGADVTEEFSRILVDNWRQNNPKIVEFWNTCDQALQDLASWPKGKEPYSIGEHNAVWITPEGIRLPNGLYIRYQDLKWDTSESKGRFVYKSRKGPVSIWGGAMTENIVQALARIIVGEQMININDNYRVVLTVHDAATVVVPEAELHDAIAKIESIMHTPPEWAKGLPVACEAKYATSYGEC